MFTLCEDTGERAHDGACPVHHGDACLRVYVALGVAEAERQAVIDVVNLYGDEVLHGALDAVGALMDGRST